MEYYKIGKLVSVVGLKGEVLLKHEFGKKTAFKGLKAIFIENKKDAFLPWFVESARVKNEQETYLKLETVDTREAATKLLSKMVWLPQDEFEKHSPKTAAARLLGYEIINHDEALGSILEVIEQPHQLVCRINIKEKEVLIPINESTLSKIDHKNRKVKVTLPEGLLDIYLG